MSSDRRVGSAELNRLAADLATPCQLGDFVLEGLISKTSTALIFVARGGPFGDGDGVLKLTEPVYAPLLERELGLLNACREAGLGGVVQPMQPEIDWIPLDDGDGRGGSVAAILLPFLAGGDLVQWTGAQCSRTGQPGAPRALEVGEIVGGVLRSLLALPHPIVHGDVKLQNVLLPRANAPLSDLTLIDLDASRQLDAPWSDVASTSLESAQSLVADVNGFGELLYSLATGEEPPSDGEPHPHTGNADFDALVVKCITSQAPGVGYACLADGGLWRDLEQARALEFEFEKTRGLRLLSGRLTGRPAFAILGLVLLVMLALAIAAKLA